MARWEPNVRGRLEQAALDLYAENGYEQTTVGDIAERAGVTPRTYFRHFPDKREVLFGGSGDLEQRIVSALGDTPAELPPLAAALHALGEASDIFRPRDFLRRRAAVIGATLELREREELKLASISTALTSGLTSRGAPEPTARLAADTAMTIFKEASRRWMTDTTTPFPDLVSEAATDLTAIVTSGA
jgi:AcrR family transcriptional regulator